MKRIITTFLLAALMLLPTLNAPAQNIELSESVMEAIQMLPDSLRSEAFQQAMNNAGSAGTGPVDPSSTKSTASSMTSTA